jgi:hypothetical protein
VTHTQGRNQAEHRDIRLRAVNMNSWMYVWVFWPPALARQWVPWEMPNTATGWKVLKSLPGAWGGEQHKPGRLSQQGWWAIYVHGRAKPCDCMHHVMRLGWHQLTYHELCSRQMAAAAAVSSATGVIDYPELCLGDRHACHYCISCLAALAEMAAKYDCAS